MKGKISLKKNMNCIRFFVSLQPKSKNSGLIHIIILYNGTVTRKI